MPQAPNLKRAFSLLLDSTVRLDFLLPNGIILPLELDSDLSLYEAKEELWLMAAKQPLFHELQPKEHYIFSGINSETADSEEFYDQSLRLRELPLLLPYLLVTEAAQDSTLLEENMQNSAIANCTGISHDDIVRASELNPEVKWARVRLRRLANMHRKLLQDSGPSGLAQYLTAAAQRMVSRSLQVMLDQMGALTVSAWILDSKDQTNESEVFVELGIGATVQDALTRLLELQTELADINYNRRSTCSQLTVKSDWNSVKPPDVSAYLLKICCSQAYLFDMSAPLVSFEYVQRCLEEGRYPCLSPVLRKDVCENLVRCLGVSSSANIEEKSYRNATLSAPRRPFRMRDKWTSETDGPSTLKRGDVLRDCSPYKQLEKLARTPHDWMEQDALSGKDLGELGLEPVSSLWQLNGYLCVEVRSAKFLAEAAYLSATQSTPSTPLLASPASLLAAAGSYVVRVGLFHGSQTLIESKTTVQMPGTHLTWNKALNFRIRLADIPPTARLCVALIRLDEGSRSGSTTEYPVGWANLNFFDYLGIMRSGEVTLHLWPASLLQSTDERFSRLYPAGTVLENPNPDFVLQIRIHSPVKNPIRRPTLQSYIDAYSLSATTLTGSLMKSERLVQPSRTPVISAGFINQVFDTDDLEDVYDGLVDSRGLDGSSASGDPTHNLNRSSDVPNDTPCYNEPVLRELVTRDPLYELSEQEKTELWQGRLFCLKQLPEALPFLTQSVCWHCRVNLMEFYDLLQRWPRPLRVPVALQLLGAMGLNASASIESAAMFSSTTGNGQRGGASGVADAYVRELAVDSLYHITDSELADYLLQLVQALKAEAYLDNSLSRFILFRALRNPLQIGLQFFWLLRSEIHLPDMRLKFGLLLEAFCRGSGPLLTFLARQVTALKRLETISARVKEHGNEDEQRAQFRKEISRAEARRDLQWLPSPMCLSQRLGELVVGKCDVKRSKKRPLWLVWTNPDRLAIHHLSQYQLIFKHGDDLRQDILTLQLLRVMDRIWKDEGMDMCLVPYGCLATGPEMGLIQAVRNAKTVMAIQRERLRAALQIDNTQLFKWLTRHVRKSSSGGSTPTNHELGVPYDRLIQNFTRSCAGYCVATFVLGIRDRHPDNIMVDTSGRLFHIDFGHILDNRKKKFGITRERVPFVLTKDFITVIAHGNADVVLGAPVTDTGGGGSRDIHLQKFAQLCAGAYMLLRKHANILLTLFAMMLPSGLPELTSVCDLEHVRKTLAVEMDDSQALAYFHSKFNEAYYGAWTTKIDWFGHWMNT
ncbi:phosphatidylinositol-4 5-bisphosphate 3-kinase [Clonorchis sinensis]|uniref:Phosphatidylinositol-4 5-bisphosphate 3-kinase n=1 Tax=Clonorchis sinensis TaxID=79923 RepID=H2KSA1_CLOSI|nr:phosphatidylinositol-4 5-bisphosphate 3-kinase [Clonorchis sinensis]